jgi:hypothetical protein
MRYESVAEAYRDMEAASRGWNVSARYPIHRSYGKGDPA